MKKLWVLLLISGTWAACSKTELNESSATAAEIRQAGVIIDPNGKPDSTGGNFGIAIDPDGKPITSQGTGIDPSGKACAAREAGVQIDGNGSK